MKRFPALPPRARRLLLPVLALTLLVGCRTCRVPVRVRAEGDGPETVVLLHGMKRTDRSMVPMARALRAEGYRTVLCRYPSRWDVRETRRRVFDALGPATSGVARVHFVTHSLGGILVRDAFRDAPPPANLGRVVMLGPPNHGSEHIDRFARIPFFRAVWGEPAPELGTGPGSFPASLPPVPFECGVIAGNRRGLLGTLLPGPNDGKVTVASATLPDVPLLVLPVNHTWMMRDPAVVSATAAFLRTGRFPEPPSPSSQRP